MKTPKTPHPDDELSMGEAFRMMRAESQIKRQMNRESSTKRLQREGIPFTSHNDGAHLIVLGVWSFWPGTGTFLHHTSRVRGRGVFNLLKRIKESKL